MIVLGDPRKAFWVKCEPCGYCWAAAYFPIDAGMLSRVTRRLRCQICGARGRDISIAKQADGKLMEITR